MCEDLLECVLGCGRLAPCLVPEEKPGTEGCRTGPLPPDSALTLALSDPLDGSWTICACEGQEGADTGRGALNGLSVGSSLKNRWLALAKSHSPLPGRKGPYSLRQ